MLEFRRVRSRSGLHRLGFSFTRDEATQSGGLARLFIDSQQVAEQVLPRPVRFSYYGSGELFGIGEDSGTTVTSDYAAPFPLNGEKIGRGPGRERGGQYG